ncbi:MAG: hypothetical protein LBC17_01740 [Lactobacillaceae bacterium]|jgi:hypothetical protein|nr:hypothetical protein [Lactobacillaceae bacterium]
MAKEFKYEIKEHLADLGNGKELNLVSYGDRDAVYDIRSWFESEDGVKQLGKGITLKDEEFQTLKNFIIKL